MRSKTCAISEWSSGGRRSELAESAVNILSSLLSRCLRRRSRRHDVTNGGSALQFGLSRIGVVCLCLMSMSIGLATWCSPAWAGRKVALVIGNSAYQHANPLRNPANDARAMAKLFGELGFEAKLVLDADRTSLMSALGDFNQVATGSDAAIFYYAGHGLSLDNRNYLVPVDSDIQRATDVRLGAAVDAEVAIDQALADAKVKLVFLDACRNNPFVEQIKRSIGSTRAASISSGLAEMKSGEGTLIAFSTAPGQTALDGSGELSPFAEAMLKELAEPGLEVRLAMTKVRADVETSTMSQQTPWESTNLTGFFYFKEAVAVAPSAEPPAVSSPDTTAQLDLEYWRSVKDSDNPSLINSYLTKFPGGVYRPLAEARLQQLEHATSAKANPEPAPAVSNTTEEAPLQPETKSVTPAVPAVPEAATPAKLKTPKDTRKGVEGVASQAKAKVKAKPPADAPEPNVKPPKKPVAEKAAPGSANDAAMLSKAIRMNSGVWTIPAGASKIGAKGYTRSFVVVYKGRQYSCHSLGTGGGSTRASCSPR